MYIIIWSYQVKPEHLDAFKKIYASDGPWTKLFRKSEGYLGTELLNNEKDAQQLITIDRWASAEAYKKFKVDFQTEYNQTDVQYEDMTIQEILIGTYILTA